jgi:nucleoid-associated protein YgaU
MRYLQLRVGIAILLVALLGACSSSQTKEDEAEIIPPVADAGTDAVPEPGAELANSSDAFGEPAPDAAPTPDATPTDSALPPADTFATDSTMTDPALTPAPTPTPSDTAMTSSLTDFGSKAAEPMTVSNVQTSGQMEDYTVLSGDTLMKFAFENYGSVYMWRSIYNANKDKISDPNSIPKGIVLKIDKPSSPVAVDRTGEKYLIKQGDTLGRISGALYGTPSRWKEIWEHNKQLIKNPNKIFSGFYLYYTASPSSASQAAGLPSSAAETSAAPLQATAVDAGTSVAK